MTPVTPASQDEDEGRRCVWTWRMGSGDVQLFFLLFSVLSSYPWEGAPLFYRCDSRDLDSGIQGLPPGPWTWVPSLELSSGEPPPSGSHVALASPRSGAGRAWQWAAVRRSGPFLQLVSDPGENLLGGRGRGGSF